MSLAQSPLSGAYWQLPDDDKKLFRRDFGRAMLLPDGIIPNEKQMTALLLMQQSSIKTPIFAGGSMGGGKLLQWDTPIATPDGFRRIDDLRPGDGVMGRDGQAHQVLAVSEPVIASAYKLTFDDGSTVVAHDEHLWLTYTRNELISLAHRTDEWRASRRDRRPSRARFPDSKSSQATIARNHVMTPPTLPPPEGTVRTTAEIVATLRTKQDWANHAIPVCEPLTLPPRDLPIDPYILGVWLGDGSSESGAVTTMDPEMVDAVAASFPLTGSSGKPNNKASTYRFRGLKPALRSLGVLGDKHVPHDYLWASSEQRLALLQGLMDTDGTVARDSGSAEFTTTSKPLADAVAHLARSLGHKARIRPGRATLYGKDCGAKYTIKFQAKMPVFRLQRKLQYLTMARRQTTRWRYIVSAERVPDERMRCIEISAPDHLYLASHDLIPTHNSALLCMAAIHACRKIPGNRWLLGRKEFKAFTLSTLKELEEQTANEPDIHHWPGKHIFEFDNGSEIWYMGLGTAKQRQRLGSTAFGGVGIDEATELARDIYQMVQTRVRLRVAAKAGMQPILLTGNPYPGWIKSDFVKQRRKGYIFLPMFSFENPGLPENYTADLKEEMPEEWYRAFVLGDWDAMVPTQAAIPATLVAAARKRRVAPDDSNCIWAIDVGHLGVDWTWIGRRRGEVFDFVDGWGQMRIPDTADRVVWQLAEAAVRPWRIVIDRDGIGAALEDELLRRQDNGERALQGIEIIGLNAQKTATIETPGFSAVRYGNAKAQNAFELRRMFESGHGSLPIDDEEVEEDLTAAFYDVIDGRVVIETKKLVKAKLGRSPDKGDALLLTMWAGSRDEIAGLPSNLDRLIALQQQSDGTAELALVAQERKRARWYKQPFLQDDLYDQDGLWEPTEELGY